MRNAWLLSVAFAAVGIFAAWAPAQEKEVTLKGTILCAKCALKQAKTCTTAILVKDGEKEVTYFFKDKGNKESYHEEVCGGDRKQGSVTGTVFEKEGRKWITPTKVVYAKASAQRGRGNDSALPAACCARTASEAPAPQPACCASPAANAPAPACCAGAAARVQPRLCCCCGS